MSQFHDRGKIFWPIAVGECPDIDDAYATLTAYPKQRVFCHFMTKRETLSPMSLL